MAQNLLENIRLFKNAVLMNDTLESMCESAGLLLKSTVMAVAYCGEILAANEIDYYNMPVRIEKKSNDNICIESNQLKSFMLKSYENIIIASDKNKKKTYAAMILPLSVKNEKIGLLIVYREIGNYNHEEIIFLEYATLFATQKINASKIFKQFEQLRKISSAKAAVETLSTSELEAAVYILKELEGGEGIVVASKIADNAGITRSIVVNALRKIESAGAIEYRSRGVKGTYIKVLNDSLINFLFVR